MLFADLAGFTGLSESLDPEQVKNVVDRCFGRLALDITSHGGRVDKVIGDAIVALFGAPVAHEDDAERAVRSALQMQQSISTLSAELSRSHLLPGPLTLRIGINSGEVLVGAIRAGGDYTAMGDVVNVASRLQTLAEPGTVVVGASTYRATQSVVRYQSLGSVRPRGREEPVDAWLAVECPSPPGRRPRRVTAPILGRDSELSLLRRSVDLAVERGRPAFAFVLGEAGMGKTRLVEEICRQAEARHNALVLEGRCLPYGEVNPFWPIAEAVRKACGVEPGDDSDVTRTKVTETVRALAPDDAEQLASGLLHLMGDEDALPDVDPQRGRQEGRRALSALVSGLARRQPVVISLAELHWADEVVLELLGWYLGRLAGLPVVILATGRPEVLERWNPPTGRHNLVSINLDPLERGVMVQLASTLTEGALAAEVVDTLVGRSGGNPFFLEELLSYVGETGPTPAPGELPVTLRGLVAARLDALGPEERSLLEDAAVVGRSGQVATLRALGRSRQAPEIDGVLARLLEDDLLALDGQRWEFRSEVVRDVVYEILTKSERARRHWALAVWLDRVMRRMGRSDEVLELLAHHYTTAAELVRDIGPVGTVPADAGETALAATEKAARWAARRELPLQAVRLLDRALALAPEGGDARCRLLLERSMSRATLRDLDGARADLEAVFEGAEGAVLARALTVSGYVKQLEGDLAGSSETLHKALAAWREVGDRAGEGDALRWYGLTSLMSGDVAGAEAAFEEGLALAREIGSRRDEAWALWHLAELSFYSGRVDEAEARLQRADRAFREAADAGGSGWVRGLLAYVKLVQGRRDEAERLALSILDETRERGDRWAMSMVLLLIASVRLWQGRAEAAVGPASEAAGTFTEIADTDGVLRATTVLARALAANGRVEEAKSRLMAALDGCAQPLQTRGLALRGLLTDLGEGRRALESLAAADSALLRVGVDEDVVTEALALLQSGRHGDAAAVLDRWAAEAAADQGPWSFGWSVAALLRAATGDRDGALDAAARVLGSLPRSTYRDLALAHLASALAHAGAAESDEADRALLEARRVIAGTEDVLTAAVIELGAARMAATLDRPDADEQLDAARRRLESLGATAEGWEAVFGPAGR